MLQYLQVASESIEMSCLGPAHIATGLWIAACARAGPWCKERKWQATLMLVEWPWPCQRSQADVQLLREVVVFRHGAAVRKKATEASFHAGFEWLPWT